MDYKAFAIENARAEFRVNADTERARRELMVARNAAYSRQQWAEVDRLTQILKTFPVKRSDGTYESAPIVCACDSIGWDGVHYACPLAAK